MRKLERPPDLEVELRLFSTEEGGLQHSLPQGRRLATRYAELSGQMRQKRWLDACDELDLSIHRKLKAQRSHLTINTSPMCAKMQADSHRFLLLDSNAISAMAEIA